MREYTQDEKQQIIKQCEALGYKVGSVRHDNKEVYSLKKTIKRFDSNGLNFYVTKDVNTPWTRHELVKGYIRLYIEDKPNQSQLEDMLPLKDFFSLMKHMKGFYGKENDMVMSKAFKKAIRTRISNIIGSFPEVKKVIDECNSQCVDISEKKDGYHFNNEMKFDIQNDYYGDLKNMVNKYLSILYNDGLIEKKHLYKHYKRRSYKHTFYKITDKGLNHKF